MSHHESPATERHCDVAIIGGSAAGLAAALQLGRQRRAVIVIDAGEPRNAPAAHMHSYLGHEGITPSMLTAIGREEVRSYGVEVLAGRAVEVTHIDGDRFRVELVGGHAVIARRVLAATGLIDELPDIEGLAQHWGRDVIHRPFCHAFEFRDQRIVQIVTHPMGLHPAVLFRQLSTRFTVVIHDGVDAGNPQLASLRAAGVDIVESRVERVVTGDDGRIAAIDLVDGARLETDVVVIGSRFHVRAEALASLGLEPAPHPSGLGDFVETDATGETSVAGIYAAGNVTDPSQQVLQAAADGGWVGGMISLSLAQEDVRDAARPSAHQVDWDHRYGGEPIWSGNPNGTLVAEIGGLTPGRALDVGGGEGGDTVWLSERGWQVTATDISPNALGRIAAVAAERDLTVECLVADANSYRPYEPAAFGLVSAQYPSIPRTPDARGLRNVLDAVAPGGTLIVVSHDLEPMRTPIDTTVDSRRFDPDAFVRVDDFAAALDDSENWDVEVHEKRRRPPGSATHSHHDHDIVFRARRHGD